MITDPAGHGSRTLKDAAVGRSNGKARRTAIALALAVLAAGPTVRPSDAQDSIPPGYGSLRRDDVAIRLRTPQVEIQLLPLDEQVIRLLAPDTYRSLTSLLHARHAALEDAARRTGVATPTIVMVTFFGVVPQARFVPDDLNITSRGRLFRPATVVAISPSWSSQQLEAREQAAALYLFDAGIGWAEPLTVSYQGQQSDSWARALRLLDRERARVMAREKP
jgi:hypothetical protein